MAMAQFRKIIAQYIPKQDDDSTWPAWLELPILWAFFAIYCGIPLIIAAAWVSILFGPE